MPTDYLSSLHPQCRAKVEAFLSNCQHEGYAVMLTSGYRSFEEQQALYQKHLAGGPQAAAPGHSFHNVRRAIDFVPLNDEGQPDWGEDPDGEGERAGYRQLLERIALLGEAEGLIWGGRWHHYDGYHLEDENCPTHGDAGPTNAVHFGEDGECRV